MVATPVESVSAVPFAGVMAAISALVVKVTTAFGTTAPFASTSFAFTVAGAPLEIDVMAMPEVLVRVRVSAGAGTIVVPAGVKVVVVVVPVVGVDVGVPLPHPARKAVKTTIKVNNPVCFKNVVRKTAPSLKKLTAKLRIIVSSIL